MAGMLEMYQIAKDMANQKAQSNPFASGVMSALKGIEKGIADKERRQLADRQYAGIDIDNLAKLIKLQNDNNQSNYQNALNGLSSQIVGFQVPDNNSMLAGLAKNTDGLLGSYAASLLGSQQPVYDTVRNDKISSEFSPIKMSFGGGDTKIEFGNKKDNKEQAEIDLIKERTNLYKNQQQNLYEQRKEKQKQNEENKKFKTLQMQQQKLLKDATNQNETEPNREKARIQLEELTQGLSDYRNGLIGIDDIKIKDYENITLDRPWYQGDISTLMSREDAQAYKWAQTNKQDTRAKEIINSLIKKYK